MFEYVSHNLQIQDQSFREHFQSVFIFKNIHLKYFLISGALRLHGSFYISEM